MATQPNMSMPRDAAKLVLWFKGLQQPTGFLVLRKDADAAIAAYRAEKDEMVSFMSYPDGSGIRSDTSFHCQELRGLTIEYPTIQLAGVSDA